ncbi:MAG: hypothetical protein AAGL98_14380 [Planctomycetota bacterium]
MTSLVSTLRTAVRETFRGALGLSKAAINLEPVPDELRQQRRKICAACPTATRTKSLGRLPLSVLTPTSTCSACHCNLYAKTKLAGETCPRGRW